MFALCLACFWNNVRLGEITEAPLRNVEEAARLVQFGVFELDLRAGELRKRGTAVKIQDKPLQILVLLLERPGEMVSRDDLRRCRRRCRGRIGRRDALGAVERASSVGRRADNRAAKHRCRARTGTQAGDQPATTGSRADAGRA